MDIVTTPIVTSALPPITAASNLAVFLVFEFIAFIATRPFKILPTRPSGAANHECAGEIQ